MKSIKNIVLIALFTVFCTCTEDTDPGPTTGTISGKVTNSENGAPIDGADIKTDPATGSVKSDSEGDYTISGASPGQYKIIASKTDYISDTVEVTVTAGVTTPGDITLDPVIVNNPPDEPDNNSPTPGAVDQPTSIILDWSTTDEDGDSLTYEVLFDTVNPPVESLVSDYDSKAIQIDNLESGTTYYWQVIITDSQGGVTTGEVWEFTTSSASDPVGVSEMDFENGIGDWSVDNGLWEVGEATPGPESAHSGQQVAGTVLGGDYSDNANTRLISPSISLPGVQSGEKIQLKFWHWYLFASGDKGLVQVSVDGGEWETVSDPDFDGSSPVWTQHVIDLSEYGDSNVRIAFYFTSNGAWINNGWYVDDVSVEKN
ncbi:MAG: carboxypeptidase regulatory-like domain-containing protein [Anditalea sp.]